MPGLRLLIVEDEPSMRQFYMALLKDPRLKDRFEGVVAGDAEAALAAVRKQPPAVVILDWGLPGKSGMDVLDAIRSDARARNAQIFVVTALAAKNREVEALDSGADDYLAKPFDPDVLLVRLLNLARRLDLPAAPQETLSLKDLRLEMPLGRLRIGKKTVELHRKEADLLRIFMRHPDMVHSANYLWDAVWGYASDNFKHTLHVTLSSLRKALEPRWAGCLENVKDQGYILKLP